MCFWLSQEHICNCLENKSFCGHGGWKIALVDSCFTHLAESLYTPIEVEASAMATIVPTFCPRLPQLDRQCQSQATTQDIL